jgi:spermidine synthase
MVAPPPIARLPTRSARASARGAYAAGGFAALTVQVLLLRELMVAWRGNEMSFGITLSVWLGLSALGSLIYGPTAQRRSFSASSLGRALLALGALAPATLLLARFVPRLLGVRAGELTSLGPLVAAAVVSLAPFTILAGFIFALAVSVASRATDRPEAAIGEVYVLEALGAVAAGLLMSFILLPHLEPLRIALLATTATSVLAGTLLAATTERPRLLRALAAPAMLVALSAILVGRPGTSIDAWTVSRQWKELGFRARTNSIYGLVVATQDGTQRSIYESGVLVASAPDRLAAEEAIHFPMLEHPAPSRVLLIGGGLGGAIGEVLKHPSVTALDYVDLDPEVIATASREFGGEMTAGLADPRVTTHFQDARFFVKRARAAYDVVILNVPDPTTAELNRFYTAEFFAEVRSILAPGGVFGLRLSSSESYVESELADVLACVAGTLKGVFPGSIVIPGEPCHMIAGGAPGTLTRDPAVLSARVAERRLDLVFVRDYYLADRLAEDRIAYIDGSIARGARSTNRDLHPFCTYLNLALWNKEFGGWERPFVVAPRILTLPSVGAASLCLAALLAAPALSRRRRDRALRRNVFASVLVVGFTELALEVAALLAFQSLYGYVYHWLAVIVAAFMAGLVLGGRCGVAIARAARGVWRLAAVQLGIALVPLALWAVVSRVASLPAAGLEAGAFLFPLIVVASAVLAGMEFPLAARVCAVSSTESAATGGRLYAADLLGAACGATLAAVFLLPVMGLGRAMLALTLMNLAALAALAVPAAVAGRGRPLA